MKKNPSNAFVRECITTALQKLIGEKPLSSITITEITSLAGVSRMSYYRNFNSKEDILVSYLNDIIANYRAETIHSKDIVFYDKEKLFLCFEYFRSHTGFIRCLMKCEMSEMFLQSLSDYIIDAYYTCYDIKYYYTLKAFAGSLYSVYISWIENGEKEDVTDLAEIVSGIYSK